MQFPDKHLSRLKYRAEISAEFLQFMQFMQSILKNPAKKKKVPMGSALVDSQ